ncbi:conserved hypothetical protein [Verticillium alfalfae VaMs.102]|uniref:Uncharacterized protein n=1 Tax=Verticillium alfalfae (strain VaMs.102 / ATCC MYA-4576 / FGSC 10136) TaxID=526221 RepID=C9SET0_VERA1|nr:conserved hypothetical protein [Verticillium alfalfae VaMs.102]EEY16673.1 conserved hypothetical protein [Verticillium alfalfae VaMs.102]
MAVRVGGDLFTDWRDRRAVLHLLESLESDHGWPTTDVRTKLSEIWDRSP